MKANRIVLAAAILPLLATASNREGAARWSVMVDPVDSGKSTIAPEFKIAIYESLVTELGKAKQFTAVLRSGDRGAGNIGNLLTLKTTVESFTAGSETKRAVTTVAGATKIKVRAQLCTRDGQVLMERVVDGNVRFLGGNLRATHNLARHVAKSIERERLPAPEPERSN